MRTVRGVTTMWLTAVAALMLLAVAPPAPAEEAGDLVVEAEPTDPWFDAWAPGSARYWSLDVSLLGATRGSLSVRVTGSGELVTADRAGLRIAISSCGTAYAGGSTTERPVCPVEEETVVPASNLALISSAPDAAGAEHAWDLRDIAAAERRHFLVSLELPATARDVTGQEAHFGVGFSSAGGGAGDDGPGPVFPDAGGPALWWGLAALAALVVGTALMRRTR